MDLPHVLQRPIPDLTSLRDHKSGYRSYPVVTVGARDSEPLVAIEAYGIAGQGHYSRPNAATKEPVAEVPKQVYVRQHIAERLAEINYTLQQSNEAAQLLGGKAELYVDEGFRSSMLQAKLYDEVFPGLIRAQHPRWTDDQVMAYRNQLIAEPPKPDGSPSPHLTGAAVDLNLRYIRADLGFVHGCGVEMGHKTDKLGYATWPDYFEHTKPTTKQEREAQKNRRVFYWVMRGALLGDDSGFAVNPTEWWHWSYGDQLWAQLTGAPEAFYGAVSGRM